MNNRRHVVVQEPKMPVIIGVEVDAPLMIVDGKIKTRPLKESDRTLRITLMWPNFSPTSTSGSCYELVS